jgi:ABC-type antimicrobial peptide transport system permease subunit
MIRHILTVIWNTRRANIWIVAELILVVYFMWGVIDPVYVLLSNRAIAQGYNLDNVLVVSTHGTFFFDDEHDYDTAPLEQAMNVVRNYPGVEAVAGGYYYPTRSVYMYRNLHDTDSVHSVQTRVLDGLPDDDYFRIFDIKDAYTGEVFNPISTGDDYIYLSMDAAMALVPDETSYIGRHVYENDTTSYTVGGIFQPMKLKSDNDQPTPTSIRISGNVKYMFGLDVVLRIRDDLSATAFKEQMTKELTPQLKFGNTSFSDVNILADYWKQSNEASGAMNKLRLHTGMTAFFLLCVFLGISGTFWLRGEARRGEIGLRKALGGSSRRIVSEFLTEAWLLTTFAWLIGIWIVYNRLMITSFAETPEFSSPLFVQNRFKPHFWIVSGIVYGLMLLIAFVGTWIPARQAASTDASEALRDDN